MVLELHAEIVSLIPTLRAFAVSLCRNQDQAEDLVQETLLRACGKIGQFEPGTNMAAWLFVILRNQFYSEYRKRRRDVEDVDGAYMSSLVAQPEQIIYMECAELQTALAKLPRDMRDVLLLVVLGEVSYSEAARVFGCAIGTVKSRIHRARVRLAKLLSIESAGDFYGDPGFQSVPIRAADGRPQTSYSTQ
jgi:RNA polymerase sigma-70 factor (ECF subfamily)